MKNPKMHLNKILAVFTLVPTLQRGNAIPDAQRL